MKHFYLCLFAAFFSFLGNAQIVDIPDPAFKSKLLNYGDSIDVNADGEIQADEAAAVTSLSFYSCTFDNITGIQAFVNLESLSFGSYTTIATPIDLSGMTSLKSLHFTKCGFSSANLAGLTSLESLSVGYGGHISFLNVSGLASLKTVSLYATHISELDLTNCISLKTFSAQDTDLSTLILDGLVNLEYFKCASNNGNLTYLNLNDLTSLKYFEASNTNLTSINFDYNILLEEIRFNGNDFMTNLNLSALSNLTKLSCYENHLSSLDISQNTNLKSLNCSGNQLTSIDFSNLHKLTQVDVSHNLFTSLDFSGLTECPDSDLDYYIDHNPNLISINIKNGKKDLIWTSDDLDCPNLVYLCLDETDREDQEHLLEDEGINTIEINTYCSFVPGGNYNTITGTVSFDFDNNGCDDNDYKFLDGRLRISSSYQNGVTYTNNAGIYNFYTQGGDFVVKPEFERPYFTVSPAATSINFSDNNNNTYTQNFCITPNGIHKDVEITIIPIQIARPGFDARYRLVYKNKGNQVLSGNIHFTFDDAVLDLVTATPGNTSQSVNQLDWAYSNLLPFENRMIDLILNVNSPQEIPAVSNGDVLAFTASIDPISEDETTTDNTFALSQTVVGSYDPNDKTCLEGASVTTAMVGNYLHYLIRFQNSGTFAAEHIVVKDLIDTTKFDMTSLQLTSASHPQVTKITNNKVEFQFANINLPTETEDEPASHGYVAFKIRTKGNLEIGDTIENKADIYFDYNFPIETNTATSTITALLAAHHFVNASVTVAPNPTKNMVHITAKDNITSLQLYDVQGRIIQTMTANSLAIDFDLSQKTNGIYFLKVYTEKGVKVEKIIKD
ncbi:leucine-rich repeat domain-containing protein [Flavobacterium sp.]|uniref:DUF7619 domain-containing protein n=1 Tax=Flavobacterium sp. TaxID=239 RepID=UPI0026377AB2|nr:leucine-rich repeat domain-containing protein [Flavobacterium sp.]